MATSLRVRLASEAPAGACRVFDGAGELVAIIHPTTRKRTWTGLRRTLTGHKGGRPKKITDKQILDIRDRIRRGERLAIIANEFGCSESAIYRRIREARRKAKK
jgi:transposase